VKELTGTAGASTPASREACLALLAAVDRYPAWNPNVVKAVDVLERDDGGQPTKVQAKLHVERGPMTRDFNLTMAVAVDPPEAVSLSRIPHHGADGERFDVNWSLSGVGPTQIRLDLAANLDVPRFLPLGGVGDSLAHDFVSAATKALTP
jgi:Polyketide cyclase / dehydrase and lipid transport